MLLFYGLGNHDPKYFNTKHNAGRLVLENLANLREVNFNKETKNGQSYFLAKSGQDMLFYSAGYMNHSGDSLTSFLSFYKIDCASPNFKLVVLHDDSDQIEGAIKLVAGGGSAGHHGINSIYKHSLSLNLPTSNIWRLKIGIRPTQNKQKSQTFVLSGISATEKENYQLLAKKINDNWALWQAGDLGGLQNLFNYSQATPSPSLSNLSEKPLSPL
jgi:PTH1 family peptidyl-tRNA hydrolase